MRTGVRGYRAGGERGIRGRLWPIAIVCVGLVAVLIGGGSATLTALAATGPTSLRADVHVRHVLDTGISPPSVRLVRDPRSDTLYYLKEDGSIFQVNLAASTATRVFTSANHGVAAAQGFAIGPSGTMYVVGNENRPNSMTRATVVKGVPGAGGTRAWSILARTADYPRSLTAFDHRWNGIVASPAGDFVYVNAGSRTDHGEVQSAGGLFPGLRDTGLTAAIFRLPTSGSNIVLPNDRATLKSAGYLFAEGTRNAFDLAFAPDGKLFATDNGPDRDMSDELNWIQAGHNYGFPWRMGAADNPQQFPNYNPATDKLLDPRFVAVKNGYYHNDPTFPPAPAGLTDPVVNLGPDADSFRDPVDGSIKDASALGLTLSTFTAHRSPLGLSFDVLGRMAGAFNQTGFMLSWTPGDATDDAVPGPFHDASQDLVQLAVTHPTATTTQVRTTRLVQGFANPIDSEIIGNRLYVIEFGGLGGLWEITFPARQTLASDTFTRTVTGGWGSAPVGGAYALGGASADFTVASGNGRQRVPAPNLSRIAFLPGVSARDVDAQVRMRTDKFSQGGSEMVYVLVRGSAGGSGGYLLGLRLDPAGSVFARALRMSGGATSLVGSERRVPGVHASTTSMNWIRVQAVGANPTTLRVKAWPTGQAEPTTWAVVTTDSTSGLQTAGAVGLNGRLPSTTTNAPVTFVYDNFTVSASR
jgi:Glucose / Sorbosone dehydrogenase